jgi:DnaJ-domain-containing protein 1
VDAYRVLGLTDEATFDEVKAAYRNLSMKYHPDINGDSDENMDRFYEITDAYNTIKGNANKIYELLELEDGCDIDEVKAEFYKNMDELSFKSGSGDKKAREKLENLRKYYNYFRSVRATKSSGSW